MIRHTGLQKRGDTIKNNLLLLLIILVVIIAGFVLIFVGFTSAKTLVSLIGALLLLMAVLLFPTFRGKQ